MTYLPFWASAAVLPSRIVPHSASAASHSPPDRTDRISLPFLFLKPVPVIGGRTGPPIRSLSRAAFRTGGPVEFDDILQVFVHVPRRLVRIVRGHRLEDPAMAGGGTLLRAGGTQRHGALFRQPADRGLMD